MIRPDCDMNARDAGGNTPLMSAAICERSKMLETFLRDVQRAKLVDLSLVNLEGKTILMLIIEHIQGTKILIMR
jgi:ankyrin repeat protein